MFNVCEEAIAKELKYGMKFSLINVIPFNKNIQEYINSCHFSNVQRYLFRRFGTLINSPPKNLRWAYFTDIYCRVL